MQSIILLLAAWAANRVLQKFIRVPKKLETRRAKTVTTVVRSLLSIFVYSVALYFIFQTLGIDVTPLLASAGIAGIALGFGARSLIEDLLSGFFLLLEDSIAVGDYIRVGDSEGIVNNLSFRTITLQDRNGDLHIIPNGQVKTVINLSRTRARINIDLTFSTEQDIDTVTDLIEKTIEEAQQDKQIGEKLLPGSEVKGIESFEIGGNMVIKTVLFTRWHDQWQVSRRFRYLLKKSFEKANVTLA